MKSAIPYHSLLRSISFAALLAFPAMTAAANDALPTARIAHFAGDRAAAISYTFDDNLRDQYTLAVPMLNEVGFKATFFVIPGETAETAEEAEKRKFQKRAWGSISWPELKEMASQGHEIASHTWSHPNLQKLSPAEMDAQFSKACEAIKSRIGKPPLTLAFPFNASNPEVEAAALKYHLAYRATQFGIGEKSTVESLNAWADKQVQEKQWGIVMIHGIATGYAALSDAEILRTHLKYVKGREDDIRVDTFANVARYQKERDAAKLRISGRTGNVICVLSSTLDSQLYDVPLTLVIEAKGASSAYAEREGKPLPVRVENGSIYVEAAPGVLPITVTWK